MSERIERAIPKAGYLIAANNAPAHNKARAWKVCDGTADEVEINAAIAALPAGGGKVELSEGKFNIAAPITIDRNSVALVGVGQGITTVYLSDASNCNMINIGATVGRRYIEVAYLTLDGNFNGQTFGNPRGISAAIQYSHFHDLEIYETAHEGMQLYPNGAVPTNRNRFDNLLLRAPSQSGTAGIRLESGIGDMESVFSHCTVLYYKWGITGQETDTLILDNCEFDLQYEHGVYFIDCDRIFIRGGLYTSPGPGGDGIKVEALNASVVDVAISEAFCYKGGYVDRAGVELVAGAGRSLTGVRVNDCLLRGNWPVAAIVFGGAGTFTDVAVENNNIEGAATPFSGIPGSGVKVRNNVGYVTENSGTSTGTGAQQTIAHGLSAAPNRVYFSNIENGANPYQSAAADATNIYVTAGNGLDYVWKAEVV